MMRKFAIVVSIVPLLFLGLLFIGPDREDHANSPAFSAALDNAVNRLEGAAVKVTAVVTPCARAGAYDYTTDPVTCWMTNPECQELTYDDRPCETLDHAVMTCDHQSPTCNTEATCQGRYTCDHRATCDGTQTCDATETCWNSTCKQAEQTCDGETPTCDHGANCAFTMDGTHTCNGSETCDDTCDGWPTCEGYMTCDITCEGNITCGGAPTCDGTETCGGGATCDGTPTCDGTDTCKLTCEWTCFNSTCNPGDPDCENAVERTSWGKIKKQFK